MVDVNDLVQQSWMLLDLLIAMVLGGLIGLEREKQNKPAGLRTHVLIAAAACLFLFLGKHLSIGLSQRLPEDAMGIDPTRILHAIIVGISFIGAGTILKSREDQVIRYLTTAATVLVAAGIGIAVGAHLYVLAAGATVLTLVVSYSVRFLE
jgi:putative Mg2+ transporter-C (MgtC) family protein